MAKQSEDKVKICFSDLNPKKVHDFDFRPTPEIIEKMVTELELLGLSKVRFHGQLRAVGCKGWELTAHFGARVIQPCVVSLDPVSTRIDVTVERKFVPLSDLTFDNNGTSVASPNAEDRRSAQAEVRKLMFEHACHVVTALDERFPSRGLVDCFKILMPSSYCGATLGRCTRGDPCSFMAGWSCRVS